MITEWLRENFALLSSLGVAGGVGTPTVWAIAESVDGPEALPWSLVAAFVILLLTGAIITLPQHKREMRQLTNINDKMFAQVEQLIANQQVVIKALEAIQEGGRSVPVHRRRQDGR